MCFGQVLVARSAKAVCAILIGNSGAELEIDIVSRFSEANLIPNDAVVYADHAWDTVPASRLGETSRDSDRKDRAV